MLTREIEIRPDAARRWQPETVLDFAEQEARHLARRLSVHRRVAGDVDERLIDGVDEDVLLAKIVEVDAVDFGGIVQIQLHPRRRHDVAEARGNLEDAAAVAHALRFQRRRHGKADRPAPARRIRDHEIGRHRIEPAHHALARGVERLEIDDEIASVFHVLHLLFFVVFHLFYHCFIKYTI